MYRPTKKNNDQYPALSLQPPLLNTLRNLKFVYLKSDFAYLTGVKITSGCRTFPPCQAKRPVSKTNKTLKTSGCLRCFKQCFNNLL